LILRATKRSKGVLPIRRMTRTPILDVLPPIRK
jgi:hypothetical protein